MTKDQAAKFIERPDVPSAHRFYAWLWLYSGLDLPDPPATPPLDWEVLEYVCNGASFAEATRKFDLSKMQVARAAEQLRVWDRDAADAISLGKFVERAWARHLQRMRRDRNHPRWSKARRNKHAEIRARGLAVL